MEETSAAGAPPRDDAIFNLIAALSLAYPMYRIGVVLAASADDPRTPWLEIIRRETPPC